MLPFRHLALVALFFLFGFLAILTESDAERLHWAALSIMTFGAHGLWIAWDAIRVGRIAVWGTVIHRRHQAQAFRAAAGIVVAGGVVCLGGGLWVLSF